MLSVYKYIRGEIWQIDSRQTESSIAHLYLGTGPSLNYSQNPGPGLVIVVSVQGAGCRANLRMCHYFAIYTYKTQNIRRSGMISISSMPLMYISSQESHRKTVIA